MPKINKPQLKWSGELIPITRQIEKIICHHTDHKTWGVTETHNYHRDDRGWTGIGYNYFIYFDGQIDECRGRHIGAHTLNWNDRSSGVCFQGALNSQQMTDEQVRSGAWLIDKLLQDEHLKLEDLLGHKDIAETDCPGRNFRWDDLRESIQRLRTGPQLTHDQLNSLTEE